MQKIIDFKRRDPHQVEWLVSQELIPYEIALEAMHRRVLQIQKAQALEQIWMLEHPHLYTAGTSAQETDILTPPDIPVYKTGRGGQITYHGPGQRVVYLMLDLQQRCMDLKAYVWMLEEWLISVLYDLGVVAVRREGRVGVWISQPPSKDHKIAAIGVRIQKWVTSHGIALNVDPDLRYFNGIIPCGIRDQGVTSLKALGIKVTQEEIDLLLHQKFKELF